MTDYPKASTAARCRCRRRVRLREVPGDRRARAQILAPGRHLPGHRRARDAGEDWRERVRLLRGPPFANGLPHYGHLLTGYAKDLVARYQTQRGHKVERRFGWDTHGLPAELEAMKQLGMTDKTQIEAMGIDKFNDACRTSVMKYADEWKSYVTRQARWVDFENDYKTLNVEYMESVLWAFKQLHEKGLTYNGYRVLPYCWKDETPLSNHELRMDDDVYKNRQDQTVTVTFPITAGESELSRQLAGVQALAWTTTPWTLPTNAALAVGPAINYVVLPAGPNGWRPLRRRRTGQLPARSDLLGAYAKDLGYDDAAAAAERRHRRYAGTELAGLRTSRCGITTRTPKSGAPEGWQIVVADYVTTTDGTGLVHQAPAFGEDDQKICEDNGIPVIVSVDEGAKFLPFRPGPAGRDRRHAGVRGEQADHPRAEGRGPAGPAGQLRAQLSALLALPQPADLPRHVLLVRRGHQVQGPHGRAQPGDQLDPGQRQGRPVRQVARQRPRLVHQPQPLLGHPSPCGNPRPGLPAHARSTARWPRSRQTSAACRSITTARWTCTGRSSTTSPARTRTTPHRKKASR